MKQDKKQLLVVHILKFFFSLSGNEQKYDSMFPGMEKALLVQICRSTDQRPTCYTLCTYQQENFKISNNLAAN
jgi:hypothetical protein